MNGYTILSALGDLSVVFLAAVLTPAVLWIAHTVYKIKTNDLPHIEKDIALLRQAFQKHDKWERNGKPKGD